MHDRDLAPELQLADFASQTESEAIPDAVLHEARRGLVNIFATAFFGSREDAISIALRTEAPFLAAGTCTVIGRRESANPLLAAFLNAASANIFDFDDTHEATIIHPAAPVFPALFAMAQSDGPVHGRDLLRALVLGSEIECRIGNAMTPGHYARGWHITSTCGIFGAAAATGHLMRLSPEQMIHAFSAAAVQSGGLVETLGTMAKSISVGNAARLGWMSAMLARNGMTGPARPMTGARGYLGVYHDAPDLAELTDGLGSRWEAALNTYKPYPVGVVLNPVVEAMLDMRDTDGLRAEDVAQVDLTGHPLLRQRTDRPDVTTGRETQVSAQHAIAIVLARGRAGLSEFDDAAAQETRRTGRPSVVFHDSDSRAVDSALIRVTTRDGHELIRDIDHARGSQVRPLSDDALEQKLIAGAEHAGMPGDQRALLDALWSIDSAPDAGRVIALAAGGPQ